MSLTYRTWILVRSCFEALPFRASRVGVGRKWRGTARGQFIELLEERQLMAGDIPTLTDISKTVHLNLAASSFTFSASDFTAAFHDPAAGSSLQSVEIESLPASGSLNLNGTQVGIGSSISTSDLGRLTYIYDPTSTFTGQDSFQWSASDGTNSAVLAANVNITLADKAPTLTNISKNVDENTAPRFNTSDFTNAFSDADGGDTLFHVTIKTLPAHGVLQILGGTGASGTAGTVGTVVAGNSFSVGQLANLVYVPNAGYTGSDSFTWNANDLEQFAATDANVLLNVKAAPDVEVLGGGLLIANGATGTSVPSFTDFGGMVTPADSNIGADTRTFTILNNGSSNFTINGNITVSGPQASDFVVTQPANTTLTLAPGQSTTFTIKFAPTHNGERNATITIPNTSGDLKSYKFAVSGTGLVLNPIFAGSTFIDEGSLILGAGPGSAAGDQMFVKYSGFLLNYTSSTGVTNGMSGTVFDSTINEGGSPFSFTLGQSEVIAGWDSGLVGMKVGETRVLLIPAGAAYSSTGSGIVPPNATLEFSVSLLKIVKPTVAVSGSNGVALTSGTKTVSTANGTDFGTLANGTVSSTAQTFTITAAGGTGAVSGTTISVAGADPADFIVTQPQGSGTTETFTVQFKPTLTGLRTAIIHVKNANATNKDFTFAVKGSGPSYVDIRPVIGTTPAFPTTVLVGASPTFVLPFFVQNIGTTALAGGTTDIHFVLQNTADNTQISFPQSTTTLKLGKIAGGSQSQTFKIPLQIPASLAVGRYKLVAIINSNHGISETLSTNDTATSIQVIDVQAFDSNITGNLVSTTVPTNVISGQPINGNVVVSVKNTGNKPLPKGQQVKIAIIAHAAAGGNTTLTTSGPFSVSKLAKGATPNFTIDLTNVAGLAAAGYTLQAQIIPVQALTESNTTDDLLTTTASNGTLSVTAVNPDISATLGTSSLPTSVVAGSATTSTGTVGVVVKNSGNIALTSDEQVTISIVAHPTGGGSDIVLVPAGTKFPLGAVAVGGTKTINVGVQFADTILAAGNYTLQAQVALSPALTETSTTNNLATVNASNLTINLTATA